jgi:hypothetical protein
MYVIGGTFMRMFPEVYVLFCISASTLCRWCRDAGITPHVDPFDNRCRWLDDNQLLLLALLHHRLLVLKAESMQLSAIVMLEDRVARLEKKLQDNC